MELTGMDSLEHRNVKGEERRQSTSKFILEKSQLILGPRIIATVIIIIIIIIIILLAQYCAGDKIEKN